jgi:predicted TIM-barrel fold metal-dependent hydrolase
MIIDAHAHFMPPGLVDLLRGRTEAPCIEAAPDGGERRILPAGNTLTHRDADLETRIAFLDAHGIDRQVLSMGLLSGIHALDAAEALPMTQGFNDDIGAICQKHPDRFSGIALLPMADIKAAVTEYQRARGDLGLHGMILPANGLANRQAADHLRPLFDAAARDKGHIFIHPGIMPEELARVRAKGLQARNDPAYPARMALNVQHGLGQAAATLCYSDFLDDWPDLTIQIANLGGTLPAVIERMDHASKIRTPDNPIPSTRLNRIYVDTASLGPRAIEAAVEAFGAKRVLFGTDCPIFRTDWSMDAVRDARLSATDRDKIMGSNAAAIFA